MIIETICDACGMEYDWAGVEVGDMVYCCQACAQGLPCTCPQHDHGYTVQPAQPAVQHVHVQHADNVIIQE